LTFSCYSMIKFFGLRSESMGSDLYHWRYQPKPMEIQHTNDNPNNAKPDPSEIYGKIKNLVIEF
jgi:hypothetical protein